MAYGNPNCMVTKFMSFLNANENVQSKNIYINGT